MRHRKHNHLLGVKTAHRISLLANLSCSLIENGRIKTTLAKARALRPTIEKVITLAKKAHNAPDAAQKIHYRRLAIARLRNKKAVKKLFDELVEQFVNRNGGYTRIYKLAMPRLGDAAEMSIIEFVEDAPKKKSKKKKASAAKKKSADAPKEDAVVDTKESSPEDSAESTQDKGTDNKKDSEAPSSDDQSGEVSEETSPAVEEPQANEGSATKESEEKAEEGEPQKEDMPEAKDAPAGEENSDKSEGDATESAEAKK